jgi:hypothetical protein
MDPAVADALPVDPADSEKPASDEVVELLVAGAPGGPHAARSNAAAMTLVPLIISGGQRATEGVGYPASTVK